MPPLKFLSIEKFRDISWIEFVETSEFSEECVMSSVFGPLNEPPHPNSILFDKTIRDFLVKQDLSKKKKIILFSIYLNTIFTRLTRLNEVSLAHLSGLFLFLIELEEQFEKPKDKKTKFDKDEILVRKFFFDLKRRIFNIFLYFYCYPKNLETILHNIIETCEQVNSNVSRYEVDQVNYKLNLKKQRCLLEYFKHYTWIKEKSGELVILLQAKKYFEQTPFCIYAIIEKDRSLFSQIARQTLSANGEKTL